MATTPEDDAERAAWIAQRNAGRRLAAFGVAMVVASVVVVGLLLAIPSLRQARRWWASTMLFGALGVVGLGTVAVGVLGYRRGDRGLRAIDDKLPTARVVDR